MRVFVSSTFYDLIDIRSELCELLKSLGISPVLSDDKLSEFELQHDKNSIETCLVNVANSDAVIIILSKRYGPSLKKAGFDDISATHLEYRKARNLNKPIYFYVRDRLEADYSIWKKNDKKDDLTLAWVGEKDHGLFEFLDEHKDLKAESNENNWFSIFSSSVDLKEAIQKDFNKKIKPKLVIDAMAKNEFPLLMISHDSIFIENLNREKIKITIKNLGKSPAFDFQLYWEHHKDDAHTKYVFAPKQSITLRIVFESIKDNDNHLKETFFIKYKSILGIQIVEKHEVYCIVVNKKKFTGINQVYKKYFHSSSFEIELNENPSS